MACLQGTLLGERNRLQPYPPPMRPCLIWPRNLTVRLAAVALTLGLSAISGLSQTSATGYSVGKPGELPKVDRILFLGDSITADGKYIEYVETVVLAETDKRYDIISLGLSSETVSGLSEPGHADGKFPRPQLQERLVRALDMIQPKLLVACYGMNDGIYHPYRDDRFNKFVGGIQKMRDRAWDRKIAVTHLTPPVFDPLPIKDKVLPYGRSSYPQPYEKYNTVLDRFTLWMNGKARRTGWRVVDIHTPMEAYLAEKRQTNPEFTLAKDGVHPNAEGHWVMAQPLLASWGVKHDYQLEDFTTPEGRLSKLYELVAKRQRLLKAAWLSEVGHKRPGVTPGLPLPEAQEKAAELTAQINLLLEGGKPALAGTVADLAAQVPTAIPVSTAPAAPAPTPAPEAASPAMAAALPEAVTPAPVVVPAPAMTAASESTPPPPAPVPPAPVPEQGAPSSEAPPASPAMAQAAVIPLPPAPMLASATLAKAETVPVSEPIPPPVPKNPGVPPLNADASPTVDRPALYPGKRSKWQGFDRYDLEVGGPTVTIVAPETAAKGKPWVWHGEFFGHKPDPDVALLERGFHIVYMRINDMLGSPPAVTHWNNLYAELTRKHGFNKKPALVGLSRGGLYCYNWATANPDKVACIYGDAPVCDFKSWPGGKGKGKGDARNWQLVMDLWGFKDEAEAVAYQGNPVDSLAALAKRKVPLLHVFGDADEVVPWQENTGLLAERYRKLGGPIDLIAKAGVGHHPHGLQDSTPIVEFILRHAGGSPLATR